MKDKSFLKKGASAAWPICLGYLPIGAAFGVLAQKAGLSPLEIGLMSVVVFAGSSQFIAVSMIAAGASAATIVMTTFAVNLRHLLMSSSLSVFFRRVGGLKLAVFAYGVTDESFAVNYVRFRQGGWDYNSALTVNQLPNLAWFFSTVAGGIGGRFIPEGAFGIDYALYAMFICLLVFQLRGRRHVFVALASGAAAVVLSMLVPGNWYIVLASMVAATLGVAYSRAVKSKKEGRERDADDNR